MDGIDWGVVGTRRHALNGKLQKFHTKALEHFMKNNKEALNQYVNGYYERVNRTKSNQPLAIERWLDKGKSGNAIEDFLGE